MDEFFEEQVPETPSIDVMQYVKAAIRRWWLIGLLTFACGIPWIMYIRKQPPIYYAEAYISFENVAGAVPQNLIQSRIVKLRSRTFAEVITAELGLTLRLNQEKDQPYLRRQDVFKHFLTLKEPSSGDYFLRFYPSGHCALYYQTERLDSIRVEELVQDTVTYNGIYFSLNPDIANQRSEVSFFVNHFQGTVGSLISRLDIVPSQTGDLLRISFSDTDPNIAAKTVNMLTGIFIEKSRAMRNEARAFISKYLKEQLSLVMGELNQSDAQLKNFRIKHQTGLDQKTQDAIDELNDLETQITRFEFFKDELELLLGKLEPDSLGFNQVVSLRYIYRQITQLAAFDNDADMDVTRRVLNDLDRSRQDLLGRFPDMNPTIIELSQQIQQLEDKIVRLAQNKLVELEKELTQRQDRMNELQEALEKLPDEEIHFIKLDRQRRADEDIYAMLLRRVKEAQIEETVDSENVSILDPAIVPGAPLGGRKRTKAFLGFVAGFCLGIGLALLLELVDRSIKTRNDVKRYLKLPILGTIPKVKFDDYELQDSEKAKSISSQIVTHDYSPTPVGEAYRSLRTSLLFSKSIGEMNTLVISSVSAGEGKSFTVANLAITLAQQKSKTLLIDTDLRRGVLHNSFNCPKKPGLTNYLTGVVPLESVLNETYVPNLSLITCGSLIPNPSELLGSGRMRRFVDGISKRFNFIIFDTPPLVAATDAVILGTLVDGVAILIRAGKTHRENIQNKLELFQNVQAKVVGVILNHAGVEVAHEGYSYYAY